MSWNPNQPYNNIPLLPPEGVELDTKDVLRKCIEARAALAGLERAAKLIPNAAYLVNTLPLLEAQASSAIENIVTTADQLFQYQEVDADADHATKEALRYRQSIFTGFEMLKNQPFGTRLAVQICSEIKDREMQVRRVPGTTIAVQGSGQVIYTPPVGEDTIRELLANWERFLHEEAHLDPLIRMAAGHYQFEAIHPFTDGNGRTGRILNTLFLVSEGLLSLPILYLSRYIIQTKHDYYRLLLDVTKNGAWEPWILYILEGVRLTAKWTEAKIGAVKKLQGMTAEYLKWRMPRLNNYALIEVLFEQPYLRIANLINKCAIERHTASRYLKSLEDIGVLAERRLGRDRLYINWKFMNLLTQEGNEVTPYQWEEES